MSGRAARRVLTHPRVEPAVSTLLRARLVRESARFAAREAAGRRTPARYRLREAPVSVVLRHGTPDVLAFDEVFYQRIYDFPAPVEAALRRLGEPLRVLDLGANIGLFGARLLAAFPAAEITALEPDPDNLSMLRATIEANGAEERWRALGAVAATAPGRVAFVAGDYATSHVAAPGEPGARELPAVDALPLLAAADLAKIDIEGSEWPLLGDERLEGGERPRVVVMEYHPGGCPGEDPREEARARLERLGFQTAFPPYRGPPGHGMAWAWRT